MQEENAMNIITKQKMRKFENTLYLNEKARATVNKYVRSVHRLAEYLDGGALTKQRLLDYREYLRTKNKAQTVNGELSAINAFLDFCGWQECRVNFLNVQKKAFLEESRELSESEYKRLLTAARRRGNERLFMLMLTVCSTGIRISELVYITVEAVKCGRAEICMKGKTRVIVLQKQLCNKLTKYAKAQGIESGHLFRTKSGKPVDRSNICHDMKKLCTEAAVESKKVFPHNLRHLFARTFYAIEKNLAHLADILGHSRIETTRIYVAVSAETHERILNRMNLII